MKTKKKILLSAVPIIAVAAVLLSLMLFRGGRLAVGSEEPAEVRFADSVYTLSSDDTEELRGIFAGKRLYRDNPSCGFDENASVKFGDSQTFCIAKDTCPILEGKGRIYKARRRRKNAIIRFVEAFRLFVPVCLV